VDIRAIKSLRSQVAFGRNLLLTRGLSRAGQCAIFLSQDRTSWLRPDYGHGRSLAESFFAIRDPPSLTHIDHAMSAFEESQASAAPVSTRKIPRLPIWPILPRSAISAERYKRPVTRERLLAIVGARILRLLFLTLRLDLKVNRQA
jgi:hypothetical protein